MKTQYFELNDDTDFLLLDLREPSDFENYHIKEAINFPEPLLNRDRFLPVIYQYKNKENRMIIIYHKEEKFGIPPAKLFFEKGFDNVYLLTGGLEEFHSFHPDHIEGKNIPWPIPLTDKEKKMKKARQPQVARGMTRKKGRTTMTSKLGG